MNTRGATGWCLEVHDLLVAKSVAGREKDRDFVRTAIRHGLADEAATLARLDATPLAPDVREGLRALLAAAFRAARTGGTD